MEKHNPYYLHSGENPTMALVTPIFDWSKTTVYGVIPCLSH